MTNTTDKIRNARHLRFMVRLGRGGSARHYHFDDKLGTWECLLPDGYTLKVRHDNSTKLRCWSVWRVNNATLTGQGLGAGRKFSTKETAAKAGLAQWGY